MLHFLGRAFLGGTWFYWWMAAIPLGLRWHHVLVTGSRSRPVKGKRPAVENTKSAQENGVSARSGRWEDILACLAK